MVGLFIASLVLSTAIAGSTWLTTTPAGSGASPGTPTLRYWTIQFAGFGLVGLALVLAGVAGPSAWLVALVTSGVVARFVRPVLDDTSAELGLGWLAGTTGRIVLPVGAHPGKVAIQTRRGRYELPARSDDGGSIARGQAVLVAYVEQGEACVVNLYRSERAPHSFGDELALMRDQLAENDGSHRPSA